MQMSNHRIIALAAISILFWVSNASGRAYIIHSTTVTRDAAKPICEGQYGTALATVVDEEDKAALQDAIVSSAVPPSHGHTIVLVWIGLTDKAIEGQWKWDDGTECTNLCIDYWNPGEPSNAWATGGEDCAEIHFEGAEAHANDLPCNSNDPLWSLYPACNHNIISTTTTTAPSTAAPTTTAPSTAAPTTTAPSTAASTTSLPTTNEPTTDMATTTTPLTSSSTTTEPTIFESVATSSEPSTTSTPTLTTSVSTSYKSSLLFTSETALTTPVTALITSAAISSVSIIIIIILAITIVVLCCCFVVYYILKDKKTQKNRDNNEIEGNNIQGTSKVLNKNHTTVEIEPGNNAHNVEVEPGNNAHNVEVESTIKLCLECNVVNQRTSKFCSQCGNKLYSYVISNSHVEGIESDVKKNGFEGNATNF